MSEKLDKFVEESTIVKSEVEVLSNVTENEPDEELREINADLEKRVAEWKREYEMTTKDGANPMQKRYIAKGPVEELLKKHFGESNFELLVSVSDDLMESLLEYGDKTGDNADNGMVVIGYEFPEKEISEAPETGNNKFKVIVKGEIFLTLLPNQLNSLRFVRSEKR